MRVKEGQEGDDGEGKEDLGEVQCENPSGHMLHPANSMVRYIYQLYPESGACALPCRGIDRDTS